MSSWLEPLCCTRRGAAHTRRGTPCQDASGWLSFQDRDGLPVQVMVVADGHGGTRYIHSDIGSWLACRLALRTTRQLLGAEATGAGPSALQAPAQRWQQLLGQELPRTLHRRWLRAVQKHWQSLDPAAAGEGCFSPLLYGTTLGLVVMTPSWWGQTGLGDWDLLRVWADGAQLLSEESEDSASGEATFSLCLPDAAAHFACRTAIETLEPGAAEFALLLSTDGIRKSCSTDSDFLALGRYLGEVPAPAGAESGIDLDASLDHISSQGSGDDVSVALALWRPGGVSVRERFMTDLQHPTGPGPQLHPGRPPSLDSRRPPPLEERNPAGQPPAGRAVADGQAAGAAAEPLRTGEERAPGRRRPLILWRSVGALAIAGLAAAGVGLLRAHWVGQSAGPVLAEEPAPEQLLEPVRRKVRELCAAQVPIRSVLVQRRSTFRGLRQGQLHQGQLLAASSLDPLNALIGLSHDPAVGALSVAPSFRGLQPCPQLEQALRQLWIETPAAGAKAGGPTPAQTPGLAPVPVPAARPLAMHGTRTPAPTNAAINAAILTVQSLYAALASKDFKGSQQYFSPMVADQFEPAFFALFARVGVSDLHATSKMGSIVNLEGIITYVDADGSIQKESRSFRVHTSQSPALIASTEFGRVIQAR